MARLSVSLLGSLEVRLDGEPVTFKYDKVLALLVYLIVEADRAHRRDVLAALLWPDYPNRTARTNLRNALAHLRAAIGDSGVDHAGTLFLRVTRESIQFDAASDYWLDVRALETCAHPDRGERPVTDLYRGPFLQGFTVEDSAAFEEWALVTRERLRQWASTAFEQTIDEQERQGALDQATESARRWVELQPWQETAHRRLMRLLALSGERSAALRQYAECTRILEEELGALPGEETSRLYRSILEQRQAPVPAQAVAAPIPQPEIHRTQPRPLLPVPATPFVGRATQLAEVRALLARPEVRLLTLTGVGGTGKTRLALQVAAGVVDEFTDGVYWIALAPLRDPALVVPTIAAALGVRESGETPLLEALQYALRDRERLLAIDNFEQVIEAAPVVGELLAAAPGLKVLATSRAPLQVYGEHAYAVPPMEVPSPQTLPSLERLAQADALSLFVQGAQRARPGFALDEENAPAVAEICARLDGLPLAIELAAARVRLLSPQAMLSHLDERRGDRLYFLTGGPRDAPARQRTLCATIEWSYNLLDSDEQRLFRRLSVFAGGCTLEAVDAVWSETTENGRQTTVLDLLESLVDQSLLRGSRTFPPRFAMLETVREYAAERLQESGEADAVRDRHAAHYAGALEGWGADLNGHRQLEALAEIEADLDNARAAWEWAVNRAQADWLDRALEGLCGFYEWRGHYKEGRAACRRVVDSLERQMPGLSPTESHALTGEQVRMRALARAWTWQGDFNRTLGQYTLADQCLERAWALLDDPRSGDQGAHKAYTLWHMAIIATYSDLDRARRLGERSMALYRAAGDRWGIAFATFLLGAVAHFAGDYGTARPLLEECLDRCRTLGDRRAMASTLDLLSYLEANVGELEKAEQLAREALALAQELGAVEQVNTAAAHLSSALNDQGRFAEALEVRKKDLAVCRERGKFDGANKAMAYLGVIARHLGTYDQARAWVHAALSTYLQSRVPQAYAQCYLELGRLALAEGSCDESEDWLQKGLAIYERFGRHPMLAQLRSTFAVLARGRGHLTQARGHLRGAVQIAVESRNHTAALQSLPAMALLLVDGGELERAVELYALASRYPYVANSRWFEDVAGREISAAAEALPPEIAARAQERGRARDLWATVEELLEELGGALPV